jgi:uncharacterized protein YcbK (DUF882 family)
MLTPREKLKDLDLDFQAALTKLDALTGSVNYTVTSAKRSPATNAAVGGVRDSSHEQGLAVDIAHEGNVIKAMRLAYWLGRLSVIRVGWYDRHIHFDIDKSKPQVQWEGKSK